MLCVKRKNKLLITKKCALWSLHTRHWDSLRHTVVTHSHFKSALRSAYKTLGHSSRRTSALQDRVWTPLLYGVSNYCAGNFGFGSDLFVRNILGYLIKSIALNRPVCFVSLVQFPFLEHISPARVRCAA